MSGGIIRWQSQQPSHHGLAGNRQGTVGALPTDGAGDGLPKRRRRRNGLPSDRRFRRSEPSKPHGATFHTATELRQPVIS